MMAVTKYLFPHHEWKEPPLVGAIIHLYNCESPQTKQSIALKLGAIVAWAKTSFPVGSCQRTRRTTHLGRMMWSISGCDSTLSIG